MKRPRRLFAQVEIVVVLVLILSTSCSFSIKKRQPKITGHPREDLAVTPNQIRLRMRSLVEPFAGEIEQSADQIAAGSSDISVKRAAINWKIEGVPAVRGSLFQPDPFTAVLDTWVLMYQMEDFFESGPGRMSFGPATPRAVDTCERMEEELNRVVTTFTKSGDVSKVRSAARQWATDHPIRYAIRDRESTLSRLREQDVGVGWSAGEVIAEVATTADDVHREIQIYSNHLFRQARWEGELLKLDLRTTELFPLAERAVTSSERAVTTLDDLTPAIRTAAGAAASAADAAKKLADVSSGVPTLITSERTAALESINGNLTQMLTFLQGERIASLKHVDDELIVTLQQISAERIAVMKELREIAANERLAVSQDIEKAGMRVVDRAAWRLAQLVAAALGFFFLGALILLLLIRRMFHVPTEPQGWMRRDVPGRV